MFNVIIIKKCLIFNLIDDEKKNKTESGYLGHIFCLRYMVENFGWKIIEPEIIRENVENINNFFIVNYKKIPNNIIFYFHKTILNKLKNCSSNLFALQDEIARQRRNDCLPITSSKCVNLLLSFGYCLNMYYNINKPEVFFPHSWVYDINFNDNPINKVLISGRYSEIYTYRQFMYNSINNHKDLLDKLSLPGPQKVNKNNLRKGAVIGKDYCEKLSEYLVCFTDIVNDSRPWLIAKYFEIMSSGSLLICYCKPIEEILNLLGFYHNKHFIKIDIIDNSIEIIKDILDPKNRPKIDIIRKNAYNLVRKKHSYINRAKFLNNYIKNKEQYKENIKVYHHKVNDIDRKSTTFILGIDND